MKKLMLIPVLVLILSGCERIVYVNVPCPKLETVDMNVSELEPLELHYRVIDEK